MRRLVGPRLGIDFVQAIRRRLLETKAYPIAGAFKLQKPRLLPLFVAAVRNGHVDDAHSPFAQQSQRQSADDALIVRMWRKDQGYESVRREVHFLLRRNVAERQRFSIGNEPGEAGNKRLIWIHGLEHRNALIFLRNSPQATPNSGGLFSRPPTVAFQR